MRIQLNGQPVEVTSTHLSDILVECGYCHERIATAVNDEIVHRQARPVTLINQDDRIEIVAPVVGG